MPNGDLSFPFSCAFVMKKIQSFDAVECTLDVAFTMIMRIKMHNTLINKKTGERLMTEELRDEII
jgi:hypothetical protein